MTMWGRTLNQNALTKIHLNMDSFPELLLNTSKLRPILTAKKANQNFIETCVCLRIFIYFSIYKVFSKW